MNASQSISSTPGSVRTLATLRYALSELWHRRVVSLMGWFACTVAAALLWQLGAIADLVAGSREQRLAAEEPTAVRLRVTDAADRSQRLDGKRIQQLLALPWVAGGGPLVEVHVLASLVPGRERLVPAEGDVRVEALAAESLAWGAGPVALDEVLLTQSLLEGLGGTLEAAGPAPATLTLRVLRTVAGGDQEHAVLLRIAGVLRRQQDGERLDIHRDLAVAFDRWCHGDDVDGMPRRSAVDADADAAADLAEVSVRAAHLRRWSEELLAWNLQAAAPVGTATLRTRVWRRDGKPLTRRHLIQLELLQPAVAAVRPLLRAVGSVAGQPLAIEAAVDAAADDPVAANDAATERTLAWPRSRSGPQLGDRVEVDLQAPDGVRCRVPFVVRSRCDGDAAVATTAVLRELRAWSAGQLAFDAGRQVFVRPAVAAPELSGLRATLHARSLEQVAELVTHLRQLGYETTDQLERYEAVRWFGRAVALLVAAIVGSTMLLAVMLVLGMNAQKLAVSVFEIGLLRAHAVPDGRIVGIYALQGLVVGGSALVVAGGLQGAGAPWLQQVVLSAFGLQLPAGVGGVFGPVALVLVVVATSLLCGVLGTALPAWWVCRRVGPVAALRAG